MITRVLCASFVTTGALVGALYLNLLAYSFVEQNLATKQDVMELKHSIETLEHKMTIKMGTMLAIAVSLLVALQKLI